MVALANSKPLFGLGRLVATPAALRVLQNADIDPKTLVDRHQRGDWGDLSGNDKKINDEAVMDGGRIMSVYVLPANERIWIITEATGDDGKRLCTTLLLSNEY